MNETFSTETLPRREPAPFFDFPEFEEVELTGTNDASKSDFDKRFMATRDVFCLLPFAHYIWWEPHEKSARQPLMLIAQVMNIGTFEDICCLEDLLGKDVLRDVLKNAEIGMFNARSWHFWHYRLDLAENEREIPSMPKRKILSQKSYENLLATYENPPRFTA